MMRSLLIIILLLNSLPAVAQSPQKDKKPDSSENLVDFSDAKHTKSGRIDKVIDSLSVELKDGTIVRLASINTPDFHILESAPYAEQALKLLKEKLPERTEVLLYQTRDRKKGRINRMEHQLAHIVTKKDKQWIQGALLKEGLAFVHTTPNNVLMLDDMYKAEEKARQSKIGMWAEDSAYRAISAKETHDKIGDYAIVEAKVEKVATIRNNTYLNFGKNWKTDFTIQIPANLRKKFAKQGVNVLNLAQQDVRVRGYLRSYNGPLIELKDTAHLEIIEKNNEQ